MASERKQGQRREECATFRAVYGETIWLSRRGGRHPYVLVRRIQDEAGRAVCDHGIMPESAALLAVSLRPGDVFSFEARHVRRADETHEFSDVAPITPVGRNAERHV